MKREHLAARAWRVGLACAALILIGSLGAIPPALADVDVRLDVGNAPPAPTFYFQSEPHRVYDRDAGVYIVDDPDLGDYDAFEYGGYDWLFSDGYWYRSTSWDGDFTVVAPQYVPTEIYDVPSYRWHHHPSYDSVHLRGWHARNWRDLRAQDMDNGSYGNRDDYDRDVHYNTTQYRATVYGDTGARYRRHHHHDVNLGIGVGVGIHKTHHHRHHADRDRRDRRDDNDDRDDR